MGFLGLHSNGEVQEEVRYCFREGKHSVKNIAVLKELYGCSVLQEVFLSWK